MEYQILAFVAMLLMLALLRRADRRTNEAVPVAVVTEEALIERQRPL